MHEHKIIHRMADTKCWLKDKPGEAIMLSIIGQRPPPSSLILEGVTLCSLAACKRDLGAALVLRCMRES